MLFSVTSRYRKHNLVRELECFELYIKRGPKGKHTLYSRHNTLDECIDMFKKLKTTLPFNFGNSKLSDDYRVKKVKQFYSEESVQVPTLHQLSENLPELKGIF